MSTTGAAHHIYRFGEFTLDVERGALMKAGEDVPLRPKAFEVLRFLVERHGQLVSKDALLTAVWSPAVVTEDSVTQCLMEIRRAIDDHDQATIRTLPRRGYLFDAQVSGPDTAAPENKGVVSSAEPVRAQPGRSRRLVYLATLALLLLAAWWGFAERNHRTSAPANARPVGAASMLQKSVAVLPFANLSNDEKNAFFARGMQDEILADLAKVADLKVISRTSVMKYRSGSGRSMRDIAKTLGVAYVIEGSVQRAGNRVRVTAQLIDAGRDTHLWADHYDRNITDVFAIQSEIARNIADQLRIRLSPRELAAIRRVPTTDLKAYELYDEARNIFVWNDPEGAGKSLRRKVALLEQATRRDPDFALAYCALAKAQGELSAVADDRTHLKDARKAVDAALRLQPDLPDAHRELGRYYFWAGELDRGYVELLAVNRIWPNDAETIRLMGEIDRLQNRWDDALANFRRASALDPRNGEYTHHLQLTYRLMHRYDEGLRFIKEAFARDPQDPAYRWLYLAEYKLDEGDPSGARKELAHLPLGFSPTPAVWGDRFRTALYLRDYDEASRVSAATPEKWSSWMFTGVPPRSWCDGLIARLRSDKHKAREIFASAREQIKAKSPNSPQFKPYERLASLALLDAELGQTDKAIKELRQSVDLVPKNPWDHRQQAYNVALVDVVIGQRDRAIDQLEAIAGVPAGLTYGELRFNPVWDPLRGTPRFEKLVTDLAPGSKSKSGVPISPAQ